jgi:DUF4097 and DUF4098 domain-containing protein YvlB
MINRTLRLLPALALLLIAVPGHAADSVTRSGRFEAASLNALHLQAGVGDVTIEQGDGTAIEVQVTLQAVGEHWFGRKTDLAAITLSSATQGRQLTLKVDARHIKESWTVRLPARPLDELTVNAGVGNLKVNAAAGKVNVKLGVGDIDLTVPAGAIKLQLGTGDATVRTPVNNAGEVSGSTGVGGAHLKGAGTSSKANGVGASLSGQGSGKARIEAQVGVGELSLELRP